MATTKAMPIQPAINIRVFKNGDDFYTGKRFVINTRTTKDFDSFLNEVTSGLRASFGAVRKLHTPVNGHKIQDLSSLENNNIYVAAGSEKFKKKSYNEHLSPRRLAAGTVKAFTFAGPIQPVTHSKIRRSARIRHISVGTKTIFVYRNGDDKELPMRLLLRYRSLQNFETVLTEINVKVNLLNGVAIRRLYKMNGERVLDCSQIDSDGKYVAAGTERFKKVAYGQWEPSTMLSPRHVKKPLPPIKARPPPRKSSPPAKPKPATVRKQKTEKKKKRPEKSAEQKEAESVFHHKPTTVKRSREKEHPNYDADDPNAVFKAKEGNSETEGAKEIEDTRETAIDLPIDQIAAEEVDEDIGGEDLPMKQESKSPEPYVRDSPKRETPSPTRQQRPVSDEVPEVAEEVPDFYAEEKPKSHSPDDKEMKQIQTTIQEMKTAQGTSGKTPKGKTPQNQTSLKKKPLMKEPPRASVQPKMSTVKTPSPKVLTPPPKELSPQERKSSPPPKVLTPPPKELNPQERKSSPPPKVLTPPPKEQSPLEKKLSTPPKSASPQMKISPTMTKNHPTRTPTPSQRTTTPLTKIPTPPPNSSPHPRVTTPTEKTTALLNGPLATPQSDKTQEPSGSNQPDRESTKSSTKPVQSETYDFDVTKPSNDNQNGELTKMQDEDNKS
ncbi:doublecortin domain-containing protein 2-like isoform X1 [Antedon mediterranea]|uniref:doublecortin domain-containing protein 2-like isoform X1 n=1 Tax=Antedon mediterranea TaxID=105859 RepID=UPI003AF798F5